MTTSKHSLLIDICNWVFGLIATSTWWVVSNIDTINKFMEFGLKTVSLISFAMIVIINRRKTIKEIKKIFNNCPDEDTSK